MYKSQTEFSVEQEDVDKLREARLKKKLYSEDTALVAHDRIYYKRYFIATVWLIAIFFGTIHAWSDRHFMGSDGISYLDMGEAYLRGDWKMAINGYWSPFYSWLLGLALRLLKPPSYWEFTVVHLANFAIYLCALACFQFFLFELSSYRREQESKLSKKADIILPEWVFLAFGYTLFFWLSTRMVTIKAVTPDMCLSAFVYLASALLLRIKRGVAGLSAFVILGVVLGFAYLTKSAMFPLAFIFLGISVFLSGDIRKAVPHAFLALISFIIVASPLVIGLSMTKGYLTFGETGKCNYARFVNKTTRDFNWQGEPAGSGTPKHPRKKISDIADIYEFVGPAYGTYPLWYDESYWNEGVLLHFDFREQIRAMVWNLKQYLAILRMQGILVICFFILYFMGRRKWLYLKDILEYWFLVIPAIAVLGMYSLVWVVPRYIGVISILLWMVIFSGVRLPDTQESRRLTICVFAVMLLQMVISISYRTIPNIHRTVQNLIRGEETLDHPEWLVANFLKQAGVQPGDKVATFDYGFHAYWARLAKVQIIAEMHNRGANNIFWSAEPSVKYKIIRAFAGTQAKIIVAKDAPSYALTDGWKKIENTDYYVYVLKR